MSLAKIDLCNFVRPKCNSFCSLLENADRSNHVLRQVEELDSRGALLLAEEIGGGDNR